MRWAVYAVAMGLWLAGMTPAAAITIDFTGPGPATGNLGTPVTLFPGVTVEGFDFTVDGDDVVLGIGSAGVHRNENNGLGIATSPEGGRIARDTAAGGGVVEVLGFTLDTATFGPGPVNIRLDIFEGGTQPESLSVYVGSLGLGDDLDDATFIEIDGSGLVTAIDGVAASTFPLFTVAPGDMLYVIGESQDNGANGGAANNFGVRVRSIRTAVPLPAAGLMLPIALAGLALLRARARG